MENKKLPSRRKMFMIICEAINDGYGDTIHIDGTDMVMALEAINKLSKHLEFPKETIKTSQMKEWRLELIERIGEFDPEEDTSWKKAISRICKKI